MPTELESRLIALMPDTWRAIDAARGDLSRAEFIERLVRAAKPVRLAHTGEQWRQRPPAHRPKGGRP